MISGELFSVGWSPSHPESNVYYYRPNVEMTTTSYIKVTLDALNIPDISLLIFSNSC